LLDLIQHLPELALDAWGNNRLCFNRF
jgi:hypothetical protein